MILKNIDDVTGAVLRRIANEEEQIQHEFCGQFDLKYVMDSCDAGLDGDAIIFRDEFQGKIVFDHSNHRWYNYGEHYWKEDLTNETLARVQRVVEIYGQAVSILAEKIIKLTAEISTADQLKIKNLERLINSFQSQQKVLIKRIGEIRKRLSRKKEIMELSAAGSGSLGITGSEWDQGEMKLPFSNGILDLATTEFRQGKPEDFIKTYVSTPWKGIQEPAPVWERTLRQVFGGDEDLICFVNKVLGYAIAGNPVEHVFVVFHGPGGRNGKGTILEILGHVLGPFAGQIESEMLLKQPFGKAAGGPSSEIMALRGRRLVWASESDDGRRLNPGKIKWLSGGDTLVGREPYGRRQISFKPSHQIILLTNHLPRADADDSALWSRILIIKFEERFVKNPNPSNPHEHQADLHLLDKLKKESSGILAWLVRGCLAWQREGLNPPEQVKMALTAYRKDEDLLASFIDDCCKCGPDLDVQAGKLYNAYQEWCHRTGLKSASMVWFGKRIKERFDSFRDPSSNLVFYSGISLFSGQSG